MVKGGRSRSGPLGPNSNFISHYFLVDGLLCIKAPTVSSPYTSGLSCLILQPNDRTFVTVGYRLPGTRVSSRRV